MLLKLIRSSVVGLGLVAATGSMSTAASLPELPVPKPAQSWLTKEASVTLLGELWADLKSREMDARQEELDERTLTIGDKRIRWDEQTYGPEPAGGHSLWISMHGGGGAPAAVNDSQYRNQIHLYSPAEGIWVVPRAPTDAWNMWHEAHIDPMFDRIIEDEIVVHGVNPNKVYLLGYSAGGDGVYQLAPRMADRFAAAAMMAGHPNDASPLGLRNLPFAIFVGGSDAAYNRNKIAAEFGASLDALQAADPKGYPHRLNVYEGLGHWMNRKDAEALPWMAEKSRDPWPKKVVWRQDDVTHSRFYWLEVPESDAAAGCTVTAEVDGQTVTVDAPTLHHLTLRLSDHLLDLDGEITVRVNGKEIRREQIPRTRTAMAQSLEERADPTSAASALLDLSW